MMRVLAILIAFVLCGAARAQDISVSANVEPTRAYVGFTVRYSVVVAGTLDAEIPEPVFPEGLDARFATSYQMPAPVHIVNGRRLNSGPDRVAFVWLLTPFKPGNFVIPPCPVTVGGQSYSAPQVLLRVMDPAQPSDFSLQVEFAKTQMFVGEPVSVKITWIVGRQPDDVLIQGEFDERAAKLYEVEPARQPDEQIASIPFMRGQAKAAVKSVTIDGEPRLAVVIERLFIPSRSGDLEVGPWSAAFTAPSEESPSRVERYIVRAPATTLKVKPLPPGAPPHFSGLVGNVAMLAKAEPTDVSVGDPIMLELTIAAGAPIERVDPPNLSRQPGFTDLFKIENREWQEVGAPVGGRVFRTTIRARTSDLVEIPPIELPYLDPETGQYAIARTRAIPLEVADMPEVTAADALMAPDSGNGLPAARPLLEDARPGLLANARGANLLRTDSPNPIAHVSRPVLLAVVAAPPAVFLAVGTLSWWRSPAQRAWRRRRFALGRFKRRLRHAGQDSVAVAGAVRAYIADRFDRSPDALTEADCAALAAQAGATNHEEIASFLRSGLRARYAGGLPDPNVSPKAASALVADIHRATREGRR